MLFPSHQAESCKKKISPKEEISLSTVELSGTVVKQGYLAKQVWLPWGGVGWGGCSVLTLGRLRLPEGTGYQQNLLKPGPSSSRREQIKGDVGVPPPPPPRHMHTYSIPRRGCSGKRCTSVAITIENNACIIAQFPSLSGREFSTGWYFAFMELLLSEASRRSLPDLVRLCTTPC